jgi:predicted MFS family arabinose efflux permease
MTPVAESVEAPTSAFRKQILVMGVGAGASISLLYFCQPLLTEMARSFRVSPHALHWVPALAQLGAAMGTMLVLPLGDRMERRRLAVIVCGLLAVAALCMASAPTFLLLLLSSFLVGFACCVPHLLLPIATLLAPPQKNGTAIGAVMSGLLLGVLLGRTLAGILGGTFGWRPVYVGGAVVMVAMAWLIHRTLPRCFSDLRVSYGSLLSSSAQLFRFRVMRDSALIGAMLFGAFNAFWTTLVFFLASPPWHYGARCAGVLGLLAAASASAAPLLGRWIDRSSPRFVLGWTIVCLLVSFPVLALSGHHFAGLIAGIILLDVSAQSGHVANLARVYTSFPQARSRAAMAYMVFFFLGASLGSSLGGWAWNHAGWNGVCAVGAAMSAAALLVHLLAPSSVRPGAPPALGSSRRERAQQAVGV